MVIVSIMIGGFFNLFTKQVSFNIYNELQDVENSFLSNTYIGSVYESENIKLIRKTVP
jgi:hypothetical protein